MANNYSAIRIPIPGNVIDTPNAANGDLLVFSNGKYQNFKPLVLDLRPYTNQHALDFRTSIAGGGSFDEATKRGMLLYSDNGTAAAHHLVISPELDQPQFARANATLDVRGTVSFGSTGGTSILHPDGHTRPTSSNQVFFSVLDSNGLIDYRTLENSNVAGGNNFISVVGNIISLNTGGLNADGALFTAGTGITITSGTISQSDTYRPFKIENNTITQDNTSSSGTDLPVLVTGTGSTMAGVQSALRVPNGNVMAKEFIARSGAGVSGAVRAGDVVSDTCTIKQANFTTANSDIYNSAVSYTVSGTTRKSKVEFANNRSTLLAGVDATASVLAAGISAFTFTAQQDDGYTAGSNDIGVNPVDPSDEKGYLELFTRGVNGVHASQTAVFSMNNRYFDPYYNNSVWSSLTSDQHRRYRADLYATHKTNGSRGELDFVVGGNIRVQGTASGNLGEAADWSTAANVYRGETAVPLHVSGYAYHNVTGTIRDMNGPNGEIRSFAVGIDQTTGANVEPELDNIGGMYINTYDSINTEYALYCKNSSTTSNYSFKHLGGQTVAINGNSTAINGDRTSFYVKATSGDIYSSGSATLSRGLVVGDPASLQAAGLPGKFNSETPMAISGPHIGVIGVRPSILLHSQPDSANSGEHGAPMLVMSNQDNDDLYGPTGGQGNAAYSIMSNRDGYVMNLERSTITSGTLESSDQFSGVKSVWGIKAEVPSGTPIQDWKNEKTYVKWGGTQRNIASGVMDDQNLLANFPTGDGAPPEWLDVGGIWIDISNSANNDGHNFALRIKAGANAGSLAW